MVLMEHPVHGQHSFPLAKVEQIKLNGWTVVGEAPVPAPPAAKKK